MGDPPGDSRPLGTDLYRGSEGIDGCPGSYGPLLLRRPRVHTPGPRTLLSRLVAVSSRRGPNTPRSHSAVTHPGVVEGCGVQTYFGLRRPALPTVHRGSASGQESW